MKLTIRLNEDAIGNECNQIWESWMRWTMVDEMNEIDCGLKKNKNETWTIKCELKEMRWDMNNEVDNVTMHTQWSSPFYRIYKVINTADSGEEPSIKYVPLNTVDQIFDPLSPCTHFNKTMTSLFTLLVGLPLPLACARTLCMPPDRYRARGESWHLYILEGQYY